MSEVTLKKN